MKNSPSKIDQNGIKVQAANDAVQAIKQLRREIVEIMSQLLCLAKLKNPKGMLPLCNEMVTKTRVLLNIWEPSLVEEAFAFIEAHRTVEEQPTAEQAASNYRMPMSPFRKITAQLGALDLKSPDLEDFATPMGPAPDLWPSFKGRPPHNSVKHLASSNSSSVRPRKSPSTVDISSITSIQSTVQSFNRLMQSTGTANDDLMSCSLPANVGNGLDDGTGLRFSETHFGVNGDVQTKTEDAAKEGPVDECEVKDERGVSRNNIQQSRNEILLNSSDFDEHGCAVGVGQHGAFLDTKVMMVYIHYFCIYIYVSSSKYIARGT